MRERWFSRRAFLLHFLLVTVVPGCLAAGWWQVHRALSGNLLSYLYSIEWPFFAVLGVVAWWQLVHDEPVAHWLQSEQAPEGRRRSWLYHQDDSEGQPVARYEALESPELSPGRTLYQMRRGLPVEETPSIATRPFRVGHDEEAWLLVNNRAFAKHPEQGGWTAKTLKARQSQPWFDPEGFLLHEVGGRLAGFCWTKVHDAPPARVGEIYVVAVDPVFAGRGLGRELTLAGLAYLSGKGITEAMLYVDATNTVAVKMYVDLGFVVNHMDRAYTGDIAPGPLPPGSMPGGA